MQPVEPPTFDVPPYAGTMLPYATPVAPVRPTSVTVLGIIGIVYASIGLLSALSGLVMQVIMAMSPGFGIVTTKLVSSFTIAIAGGNLALAGVLLAASIGSLRMRTWARTLMVRWAIVYLVWLGVEAAVQMLVILPQTLSSMMPPPAPGGTPPPAALPGFMKGVMYGSALAGMAIASIFPIFVLVYMRKPHVRAAFDRAALESALPRAEGSPS